MKYSIDFTEFLHIAVSVIALSLAFTLFPVGAFSGERFLFILVTVGSAFVLHELAHKYVAIKYGAQAKYKAWTVGLVAAIAIAFFTSLDGGSPWVFAAPGAVYIYGKHLNAEQYGKVALAGPIVNLVLAFAFFLLFLAGFSREFALTGMWVNAFLGAFNMIPFGPFDGAKVRAWNEKTWLTFFIIFVLALFLIPS